MRPYKCRKVEQEPEIKFFKPNGIPAKLLEKVVLTVDEFESVRLADLEGLYQEEAAERMNISRQTFGNIIASAHSKIADCIVNAKALKIEGGEIEMKRNFFCTGCKNTWDEPFGTGRPEKCPKCGGINFSRVNNQNEECRRGRKRRRCFGKD
ncbi:MAG: DUF134 domain-containing protein [Deltaproteobacteria bacterium]|jgi:predicted DNA-binding protein (UPF0251 family)|nr:DUF134 domain-containing protein [Deltaproteobacteria bacterium]